MNFSVINEYILAAILGIIQGISEFLPISSTAHLRLVSALLLNGRDIGLGASNIIQFGTLIAILQYFRKDLKQYYIRIKGIITNSEIRNEFSENFRSWWDFSTLEGISKTEEQLDLEPKITNQTDLVLAQLAIGTLPVVVFGLILKNMAENSRTLVEIGIFLLAGSALMYTAEWIHTQAETKKKPKIMTPSDVILIGLFQSLAAFPGISRSGATISGALMLGRDRKESVRFSFLLSIPSLALLGLSDIFSTLWDIKDNGLNLLPDLRYWTNSTVNLSLLSLFIAFILAYLIGLVVLKWLLKYLSTNTFQNFIIYRVLLAVVIIAYTFFGIN
jgi:undecaprenyl-diphosphatase